MKKLFSKVVLLSLFGLFVLSSCSKDGDGDGDGKVSVTETYTIVVNATIESNLTSETPALSELRAYTDQEIKQVAATYNKAAWTITAKGATKAEASAAADKKAIELFNSLLPEINKACAAVKTKFDAKRTQLASGIAAESNKQYIKYLSYGGYLEKEIIASTNSYFDVLKEGDVMINFEALGGTQY